MPASIPSRAWLLGMMGGLIIATSACSESKSGQRRFRYADAVEVPVSVTERDQLASMMAGYAYRNGLAFRDSSPRTQRVSNGRQTLDFEIDRPLTNGHLWTETQVSAVGNDFVLITFAEPLDDGIKEDAEQGRAEVISALRERWPAMAHVPLAPDGGLQRR